MAPRSAFVTGGTGFVGRAIVEALVADGRPVSALVRSEQAARSVAATGAVPVPGDVLDPGSLARGMRGSDVVYHVAGLNAFCLADPTPLFRVNVDGSRNVVQAAARAGVERVVYTSSAAVLGEERGSVADEQTAHRGWFLSAYEHSKFEAERAVLVEARSGGVEVVCVNPASVHGPGRTHGTARLLLGYLNGRLRAVVDSRLSLVDIGDCTRGHILAEERGRNGERYVLSGASLTVREALALLGTVTGVRRRVVVVPPTLAVAGAAAVEAAARALGRHPPVCRELARTMLHGHAYDGSRATRDLGLAYTSVEETMRRTVAWYAECQLLRA